MNKRSESGINYRIILYCFILSLVLPKSGKSQTPIFVETFGNTPAGLCDQGTLANGFLTFAGPWTVTQLGLNDASANEWYISASEPGLAMDDCSIQGCYIDPSQVNRTLHIGNVSTSPNAFVLCATGDCGAVYDPGGFVGTDVRTDKRAESPSFLMIANKNYVLSFNYLEGDNLANGDNCTVDFFDGSFWQPAIYDPSETSGTCSPSFQWKKVIVPLPVVLVNTSVKIGFHWINDDGGVGSYPSFAVDSIIVVDLPAPAIPVASFTVSNTNICVNDCINFFGDSAAAGFGANFTWAFSGAATPGSSIRDPSNICYNAVGTYNVTLIVSNSSGSDTATASIVVVPCSPPIAGFAASDSSFCERSCITFYDQSINGATGWNWSFPGGIPSSSTSPNPPPVCYNTPGNYDVTLIAFNQFGPDTLTKTAYLSVNVCPLPVADFNSLPYQFCPQHCVSFSDNSAFGPITSYQWSFPGGNPSTSTSSNPSICYDQEGFYDVTLIVSNQYGSDTIVKYSEVGVQFVANAFASPDTEMFFGESYQLNAGGGVAYQWTPAVGLTDTSGISNPAFIPNPLASPTVNTTYVVAITDAAGCTSYRQVTITILHDNDIFIPNSFSPNNDGANDLFMVRGNNIYGLRLTVFDRWGEKIYETTSTSGGWDGTYKGKELDPAVFTWVATINYNDKKSVTKSGTVTLVR